MGSASLTLPLFPPTFLPALLPLDFNSSIIKINQSFFHFIFSFNP